MLNVKGQLESRMIRTLGQAEVYLSAMLARSKPTIFLFPKKKYHETLNIVSQLQLRPFSRLENVGRIVLIILFHFQVWYWVRYK